MSARRILILVGDYVRAYEAIVPAWLAHPAWLRAFPTGLGTQIEP